jgi:hypothetical protein
MVAATADEVVVAAVAIVRMGFLEDVDMGLMMAMGDGIGGSEFYIQPQSILHRVRRY